MLEFLVTSAARRRLLLLLWGEGEKGSVRELAEMAGVSYGRAYEELKTMKRLGLVRTERVRGDGSVKEAYRANREHPNARVLRELVTLDDADPHAKEDDAVRRQLRALGAPLSIAAAEEPVEIEPTLVAGASVARRDPTVARVLPLCFWLVRDRLDGRALVDAARQGDKRAMGFFLDLTSKLSGDGRFSGLAEMLRPRRPLAEQDFFEWPRARRRQDVCPPETAQRWGFRMNMGADSFRDTFRRFTGVHEW